MKSILEASARDELAARVSKLNATSKPAWGKMSVGQMLRHCVLWDEMVLRNIKYKRPLPGLLLGRIFLRRELKDDRMAKNNPSVPELIVTETISDIDAEKEKLILLIHEFATYSFPDNSFVHPFFGKMTNEEVGLFVYKHSHHHLMQFGV